MVIFLWVGLALFSLLTVITARRVFIDPDWEDGDWWVLSSWAALRGAVFAFFFPVVRTEHTREQERTNALWVMVWGLFVTAISLGMTYYERVR